MKLHIIKTSSPGDESFPGYETIESVWNIPDEFNFDILWSNFLTSRKRPRRSGYLTNNTLKDFCKHLSNIGCEKLDFKEVEI